MGRCIYKPNPDRDEYVIWSTIVDSPVSEVMSREDMIKKWGSSDALDRADETGASWQDWRRTFWGTEELIREMHVGDEWFDGWYRVEDLPAIMEAHDRQDANSLRKLITPIEEDDE